MSSCRAKSLSAIAALWLGITGTAGAQSSAPAENDPNLATISRSVEELVEILRLHVTYLDQDLELRRIEVAIAALELRSKFILQMEGRLQQLQAERDNAEQHQSRIRQQTTELEDRLAETNQTTNAQSYLNLRRALERLETETELIENTIWDLDRQILDLQNQIARERSSLASLEEMVEEALESF